MTASVLTTIFIVQFGRTDYYWRRLCVAVCIAALAFVASAFVIVKLFTFADMSLLGFYLLLAVYELLALLIVQVRRHPKKLDWQRAATGSGALVLCLLLFGLTVNDFYQYYPTPASLLPHHYAAYKDDIETITKSTLGQGGSTTVAKKAGPLKPLDGKMYSIRISNTASHFKAQPGLVYIPYAYAHATDGTAAFPVLVLLNGTPGMPIDWVNGVHLQQTLDAYATKHNGFAPLVVIPDHGGQYNADTECVNSSRGNVETYLSVDVPAYIRSHFRASSDPNDWGIGGFSEGGYCAAMLALRHQNVYEHFLDMSGYPEATLGLSATQAQQDLFNGSAAAVKEHDVDWLLANKPLNPELTGQFIIARDDDNTSVQAMETTYQTAKRRGMPASLEIIPQGGHTFALWAQGFKDATPELSYELGVGNL